MAENLCYKCGAALPVGSERCPNCGAPAPLSDSEIKRSASIRPATIIPPAAPAESSSTRPINPTDFDTAAAGATRPIRPGDFGGGGTPDLPVMPAPSGSVHTVSLGASASGSQKPPVAPPPAPYASTKNPKGADHRKPKGKKNSLKGNEGSQNRNIFIIIGVLAAAALLAAGGWLLFGKETAIDQENTAYTIGDVPLRSSQMDGTRSNVFATILPGTAVQVTWQDDVWSKVTAPSGRLRQHRPNGNENEGYVANGCLLDRADYCRLMGIFPSERALSQITEAHERQALLHYFRANGFVGEVSTEAAELGVPAQNETNVWRFRGRKSYNSGEVYRGHIYDPTSRLEDIAFVLYSPNVDFNRLVIYSFADDGTPIFRCERQVGNNYIITDIHTDETQPDGVSVEFLR